MLIYNPNAGTLRRRPRLLEDAMRELEGQGHAVRAVPTGGPCDATHLAAQAIKDGADVVLAAGGDGTINEVLNGMVGSSIPLAVLPAGTANVLAMETGVGRNPRQAARKLNILEPQRIALGLVRNTDGSPRRHFTCMAGAGLDAHIVMAVNPWTKRTLGKLAYWIAGFQSLSRKLEELDVTVADDRRRCSFALVSRVRNYGGDLEIVLNAGLLQNQFGVYLFEGSNPFRYLKYFSGVFLRNAAGMQGVTASLIDRLSLRPADRERVYLQLDGEDAGELPACIELVPDALTVLLPPRYLAKERARWTT